MATTFNPSDKNSDISLSNGDLTASKNADTGWAGVRGTSNKTTGKWYIEFNVDYKGSMYGGQFMAGLKTGSSLLSSANGAYDWIFYIAGTYCFFAGSQSGSPTSFANGDVICVAYDAGAGTINFYKNGSSTPFATATGVPSGLYPVASLHEGSPVCTLNPGNSSGTGFTYTPTATYDGWDKAGPTVPTVTTQAVSDITTTTATGNGNVTADGGASITERGVCWGASANPTTSGSHATATGTTGAFTAAITGLSAGTHYHVRAYAINSEGTSYGADVEFDTEALPPWRFENLNGLTFDHDDKKTIYAERLNEILDRLHALDGLEPDPEL